MTTHERHTGSGVCPTSIEVSGDLNLSPRSTQAAGRNGTSPANTGNQGTYGGTERDAQSPVFTGGPNGTTYSRHTSELFTTYTDDACETSDKLPTEASKTSDRTDVPVGHSQTTATGFENHSHWDEMYTADELGVPAHKSVEDAQHQFLDSQIAQALTQLAVLPGNVSGTAFERHVASVERAIPVGKNGRAKGDCSLADFQQRAQRVQTVKGKTVLLVEIRAEIKEMTDARRQGWHDLGTVEGRYRAGERADQVGVKQAAREYGKPERSVRRWRQEFRTAR